MIKQFYQNVGVKKPRWVLDFHKLAQEPVQVWIILSGRESQGKTTNALQYLRENYLKLGQKGVYVFNNSKMFPSKEKFISANQQFYPESWKDVEVKKLGMYDKKKEEMFIYFANLSSSGSFKTGTRDPAIRTIIYDEFNEGLTRLGFNQIYNFESIVNSSFSVIDKSEKELEKYKIFILGNTITSAVPIFTQWKIERLPESEIAMLEVSEDFKVMFFNPKFKMNKQKAMEANWVYRFSNSLNQYESSISGSELLDNFEGVVPKELQELYKINTQNNCIKITQRLYLKMWFKDDEELDKRIHFFELVYKETSGFIYCLNKSLREVGVIFDWERVRNIQRLLANRQIYFSNYVAKHYLLKTLGVNKEKFR